jgi:hypothetical protein
VNNCDVFIMTDPNPQNPRTEWDNACTMVCWHKRYNLGDKHDFATPEDFKAWWDENHKDTGTIMPLYLYDHSGITIRTNPFDCPWDGGQVGWAYITAEQAESERLPDPAKCIEAEVGTYDEFIRGEVYCFSVEDEEGYIIDGSCGYYGLDHVKEEAIAVANGVRNHVRYTHDNDGMPISAVLSVRIDRKDFERIIGEPLDDDDFTAAIQRLSGRMFRATVDGKAQREVMQELDLLPSSPDA